MTKQIPQDHTVGDTADAVTSVLGVIGLYHKITEKEKTMSAYVVDDITINRILGYLQDGKNSPHYLRNRILATVNGSYEELGKAMYRLNCQSVDERYGQKAEDMYGDEYVYRYEIPMSDVQAYKSLQCYLYQSCEGNCSKLPLYKMLDEFKDYLGVSIIANLPEYDKAEWA